MARASEHVERIELYPIDPVTNGPQLFYGLRYLIIVNKPDNVKTYHEQVGYWLWEPKTKTVIQTLGIPRGQIAMASAVVEPDAKEFELVARLDSIPTASAPTRSSNTASRPSSTASRSPSTTTAPGATRKTP
jgi:hypothetical protein